MVNLLFICLICEACGFCDGLGIRTGSAQHLANSWRSFLTLLALTSHDRPTVYNLNFKSSRFPCLSSYLAHLSVVSSPFQPSSLSLSLSLNGLSEWSARRLPKVETTPLNCPFRLSTQFSQILFFSLPSSFALRVCLLVCRDSPCLILQRIFLARLKIVAHQPQAVFNNAAQFTTRWAKYWTDFIL